MENEEKEQLEYNKEIAEMRSKKTRGNEYKIRVIYHDEKTPIIYDNIQELSDHLNIPVPSIALVIEKQKHDGSVISILSKRNHRYYHFDEIDRIYTKYEVNGNLIFTDDMKYIFNKALKDNTDLTTDEIEKKFELFLNVSEKGKGGKPKLL